jgi:hypothetical protein
MYVCVSACVCKHICVCMCASVNMRVRICASMCTSTAKGFGFLYIFFFLQQKVYGVAGHSNTRGGGGANTLSVFQKLTYSPPQSLRRCHCTLAQTGRCCVP